MKKILFPVMIASLALIFSCGESSSEDTTENSDTSLNEPMTPPADEVVSKTITLSSSQEVPENKSKATGTAEVSYNKSNKMLKYSVKWDGRTGNATMAHIHGPAPKGKNAGVKQDLTGVLQKEKSGSFTDSVMVDGNNLKEDSLMSGFYYFNIHTKANPAGEIRGQIEL
jgi:hypothetical protein